MAAALPQLDDEIVHGMAIGAVFTDYTGKINCLDFHRTEDLMITSSEDDSIRLYNITSATWMLRDVPFRLRVVSLCMSPVNDSFMSGSLDHSVRIWDLRVNACQGILRLRGRPSVAYDQQGLVFAVAMEGGAINLFDSRSYDKGPFDTFLVGGDTAEVSDIKFSNDGKSMLLTTTNNHIYVLDAYVGDKGVVLV
ncbi:Transducin/WD40 repeat-like superfamily protein [Zea mays]|uniref:Transducin/WD40 repeat-like superfamily protein n=1 Tax=Zea mays TaxID=4577 RepID=A0A1D6FJE8_MAIZE|nr:Transducin/WD40 repeat-like superfamily protein [Zea mays]